MGWFAIIALLSGCTAASSHTAAVRADVVVTAPAGVEARALLAAAEAYQQATGQVVLVKAAGQDNYQANLDAILLAGRADLDLAYLPAGQLARWVRYHALQPVATTTEAAGSAVLSSLQPWLAPLTYAEMVYGYPTQAAVEAVWYRTDWLSEAGIPVPTTWEAFLAAAQRLNRPPDRAGVALAAGDSGAGTEFAVVLAGFGGRVFEISRGEPPEVNLTLNQPETLQMLTYYSHLGAASQVPSGDFIPGRTGVLEALRAGRAGLAILPLTLAADLLDCEASPRACTPAEPGPAEALAAFTPLPGLAPGVVAGEFGAWVIPLNAAHAQAARDFGAWLVGPDGARVWADNGGIPVRMDLSGDPELAAKKPYLALLDGVKEVTLPYPSVLTADEVALALWDGAGSILTGSLSPQAALDQMQVEIRRALYRGGYSIK